jgi:hypothetical protein
VPKGRKKGKTVKINFDEKGTVTLPHLSKFYVVADENGNITGIEDPLGLLQDIDCEDVKTRVQHIAEREYEQDDTRPAMNALVEGWARWVKKYAGNPIPFRGPHCGVHIRRWRDPYSLSGWSDPAISVECDPGYCGLGAAMDPGEARRLGSALIRAAEAAEAAEIDD